MPPGANKALKTHKTLYFSFLFLPFFFRSLELPQRGHQCRLPLFKCIIKMREKNPAQAVWVNFLFLSSARHGLDLMQQTLTQGFLMARPRSRSHPCRDRHWGLPHKSIVGKTHLMCTCPGLQCTDAQKRPLDLWVMTNLGSEEMNVTDSCRY